ncbi:MAG: D-alanine--D-alanine ligase [Akkermansiaceae bacterium]|nr:D-alanine--D-alanine ligase [Akkermansiaceae bacterium]
MLESTKIAVLMGGPGSEREVSLASGKAVLSALQGLGLDAVGVEVTDTSPELPEGTDLAFNVIHGTFGEDGGLQSYLEGLGIPYTGAGVATSRSAFDKNLAKKAFLKAGVPTPRAEVLDLAAGQKPTIEPPLVVKPPREGSSVGLHIVKTADQLDAALADAASFGDDVLIEQYIEGMELTVAIVEDRAFPIVHIIPPEGVYDMSSKYPWLSGGKGSQYICPADLDEAATKAVQEAALAAHRALGIEIYSRVDVLLDSKQRPFVLEANTIPGMTETSLLPKSAAAAGIPFPQLCQKIAEASLALRT